MPSVTYEYETNHELECGVAHTLNCKNSFLALEDFANWLRSIEKYDAVIKKDFTIERVRNEFYKVLENNEVELP